FLLAFFTRGFFSAVAVSGVSPAAASFFFSALRVAFCFAFLVSRVSTLISSVSTIRIWLVRFKIRLALPRARAMIRLNVGPSPTVASHNQAVRFQVGIVLRVGDCALQRLADQKCRFLRRECEKVECGRSRQTLDLTRNFAHLEGRNPRILVY